MRACLEDRFKRLAYFSKSWHCEYSQTTARILLTVQHRPSHEDQQSQMNDSDTITILARARDDSSSLMWLRDAESTRTVTSIASENMEMLDKTFDFDELIGFRIF